VSAKDLAWLQVLDGECVLRHDGRAEELDDAHIAFLPPEFRGTISAKHAAILYAEVPDAAKHDPAFTANPPQFRLVNWKREPVLQSEHDARKRVYLVTPKLFGTHALKGEMIIYPPGTEAAKHYHTGTEHFMYVLKGRGTAYANETAIPVRNGDLIYYGEAERHYLRSEGDTEMVFVEFFVPGEQKTVWVDDAPVCTWLPTGRDIRGQKPAREIAGHSSAIATPQDV